MIGYCAAVDVDVVLVWKFDRFARNLKQHLDLRSKLLKLGVEVRSVTEPVSEDPAGHLLENMLAAFAQFDNDRAGPASENSVQGEGSRGPVDLRSSDRLSEGSPKRGCWSPTRSAHASCGKPSTSSAPEESRSIQSAIG